MSEEEIQKEESESMRILDEGFEKYEKNSPEVWYPTKRMLWNGCEGLQRII